MKSCIFVNSVICLSSKYKSIFSQKGQIWKLNTFIVVCYVILFMFNGKNFTYRNNFFFLFFFLIQEDNHQKMEIRISMGGKSYIFTDTLYNAFNTSKEDKRGQLYKFNEMKKTFRTCNHTRPVFRKRTSTEKKSLLEKIKKTIGYTIEGNQIDRNSRFLFPFCYLLFLIIYFVSFIYGGQDLAQKVSEGETYWNILVNMLVHLPIHIFNKHFSMNFFFFYQS